MTQRKSERKPDRENGKMVRGRERLPERKHRLFGPNNSHRDNK